MPHTSEETVRLLVRRMRAGLWILVLALVLFGLKLVALRQGDGAILIGLKTVQLATVLGMFWLLRDPRRWRWVVPAALVTLGEVSFTTAASGILEGDVSTTFLLFTIMVVATVVFLPWGARAQAITVAMTTAAALWNVIAVGAPSRAVASPAVALALASVTSLYMAWEAERHQRERLNAAAAVAAAHARSEAEARVFAALARVGQEMIAVVETPVILDRLCRLTSEVLGCDRSHTWLWKPEEDAFVPVAGFGDLPGYAAMEAAKVPRVQIRRLLARLEREEVVQQGGDGELPSAYTTPASIHGALRWGDADHRHPHGGQLRAHRAVHARRSSGSCAASRRSPRWRCRTRGSSSSSSGRAGSSRSSCRRCRTSSARRCNVILGYAEMLARPGGRPRRPPACAA